MIVVVILLFIFFIYYLPFWINIKKTSQILGGHVHSDIKNTRFKTGDVLMYRWNYTVGTLVNDKFKRSDHISVANTTINLVDTYIYDIPFIHVGVIVYHLGKPYILELNVTDLCCEYEKRILKYKPTLTSLDSIKSYYGIVGMFPYIGADIKDQATSQIISEKKDYTHARHATATLLENMSRYVFPSVLEEQKDSYYVNCVQYALIVLEKMNIFVKDQYDTKSITPKNIYDECMLNSKYSDFVIIKNDYVESF